VRLRFYKLFAPRTILRARWWLQRGLHDDGTCAVQKHGADLPTNVDFFFTKKVNVQNWQCCLKLRPGEANVLPVLPFAAPCRRTVDSNAVTYLHVLGSVFFLCTHHLGSLDLRKKLSTFRHERVQFSFNLAQQPPVGQGLLIHEVSRSHSTTHHSR